MEQYILYWKEREREMEDYYRMKKDAIASIVQETWVTYEFDQSSNG